MCSAAMLNCCIQNENVMSATRLQFKLNRDVACTRWAPRRGRWLKARITGKMQISANECCKRDLTGEWEETHTGRSAVILERKYGGKRYQCKRVGLEYLSTTKKSEKSRADTIATLEIYAAQTDRGEANEIHFMICLKKELPPKRERERGT